MGWFALPGGSVPLEYVNYILWGGLNYLRIFSYYSYIQFETWKFGWSYTSNTFHIVDCSSRYVSKKILFIVELSLKITDIVHNQSYYSLFV